MQVLPYFSGYIFAALIVIGFLLGDIYNFLAISIAFIVLPLLDHIVGTQRKHHEDASEMALKSNVFFRCVTLLYAPLQVLLVIGGAYAITHVEMNLVAKIGFVLSTGVATGGLGITIAHELLHRLSRLDKCAGQIILLLTHYMHFEIEHRLGHHARMATPEDHATARFNEPFYQFFFRSLIGGFKGSWKVERAKGSHVMFWYACLPILTGLALTVLWGLEAWMFYLAQSIVAIIFLELVNYIQHYGLVRKRLESGKYERPQPKHCWEGRFIISNYMLFQLQRHADHHMNAARPYQILQDREGSPQLPFGYPGLMIVALWPRLWFKIMNERVVEARNL